MKILLIISTILLSSCGEPNPLYTKQYEWKIKTGKGDIIRIQAFNCASHTLSSWGQGKAPLFNILCFDRSIYARGDRVTILDSIGQYFVRIDKELDQETVTMD